MFTGLIQDIGKIVRVEASGSEASLVISSRLGPYSPGESIAINGACLSVTSFDRDIFTVFASRETLARTGLGTIGAGTPVNLEKALRMGDPLGGHLVSGHVDARISLLSRSKKGEAHEFTFSLPEDDAQKAQIAPKGSVALDGVSLTVNRVEARSFDVMIIPLTLGQSTLGLRRPGDLLNLETDLLAKYVARYSGMVNNSNKDVDTKKDIDIELLARSGFMR